jgi:hypothetical protein
MTGSMCLPQSGAAITEQGTLAMKSRYISLALSALCFFLVAACNKPANFTGFWKTNCTDAFGVQIKKQTGNLFSVSFCGLWVFRTGRVDAEYPNSHGSEVPDT